MENLSLTEQQAQYRMSLDHEIQIRIILYIQYINKTKYDFNIHQFLHIPWNFCIIRGCTGGCKSHAHI